MQYVEIGSSKKSPCQVLYMHDGQMLFDESTTWNKQAWQVDDVLATLIADGKVGKTIVVGIWNNGKWRHSEYFPEKFLPYLPDDIRKKMISKGLNDKPQANAYLRFVVEELKPKIDAAFATRHERENTFVMGSSMGGLISLYAISEYPEVFGGAACLSTHWIGGFEQNSSIPLAAFRYLQDKLPAPATHRLYMDRGTLKLDAMYSPHQEFVDQLVRDAGYKDKNSISRVFEGADHTEKDWNARLHIPLMFLLAD
jgi:enterochelin esterase-like enzyme